MHPWAQGVLDPQAGGGARGGWTRNAFGGGPATGGGTLPEGAVAPWHLWRGPSALWTADAVHRDAGAQACADRDVQADTGREWGKGDQHWQRDCVALRASTAWPMGAYGASGGGPSQATPSRLTAQRTPESLLIFEIRDLMGVVFGTMMVWLCSTRKPVVRLLLPPPSHCRVVSGASGRGVRGVAQVPISAVIVISSGCCSIRALAPRQSGSRAQHERPRDRRILSISEGKAPHPIGQGFGGAANAAGGYLRSP